MKRPKLNYNVLPDTIWYLNKRFPFYGIAEDITKQLNHTSNILDGKTLVLFFSDVSKIFTVCTIIRDNKEQKTARIISAATKRIVYARKNKKVIHDKYDENIAMKNSFKRAFLSLMKGNGIIIRNIEYTNSKTTGIPYKSTPEDNTWRYMLPPGGRFTKDSNTLIF